MPATGEYERRLRVFGADARIAIGAAASDDIAPPELAALSAEALLCHHHRILTRFEPDSELSRLNAAAGRTVPVSATVLAFIAAARWAFERSAGLVDATVIDALEDSGYTRSLDLPAAPGTLERAVAASPGARPALPRGSSRWAAVALDAARGTVTRPPGVRFDSGGITKGHAADLAAAALDEYATFAVDCGGDMRIGGTAGLARRIDVLDPFTGRIASTFELARGAIATSGIGRRLWDTGTGPAHHLIDPARGVPAWSGLVQATAVAPTALEAEVLAKSALLSGPDGAERWLGRWGGLVVDDNGAGTAFGPLRGRAAWTLQLEAA
jgi:thiamine biosynthesis lipoprotein